MKYLLDTNVCIKILNGSSENILKRIMEIDDSDIFIPAIVRFELFYGAFKSKKSIETLKVLNEFLNSFNTIEFNDGVAAIAGEIRADLDKRGNPIGPYDLIIAATTIFKNFTLVTHNVKEFSRISYLQIEDWEKN